MPRTPMSAPWEKCSQRSRAISIDVAGFTDNRSGLLVNLLSAYPLGQSQAREPLWRAPASSRLRMRASFVPDIVLIRRMLSPLVFTGFQSLDLPCA
jgi:hypothetical protein